MLEFEFDEAVDTTYSVLDNMALYMPQGGLLIANNGPQFNFPGAFTLVLDFLLLKTLTATDWLIGKGIGSGVPNRYNASLRPLSGVTNGVEVAYAIVNANNTKILRGGVDINDLERHKIVLIRDAANVLYIYLDGVLIKSEANYPADFSTNAANFTLGTAGTSQFLGVLFKTGVLGRVMTTAEIAEFQASGQMPDDELRALFNFDEASGVLCLDSSSNETSASLSNYPAGVTEPGGHSRVHVDAVMTFRAFLDAAHPAKLTRTFTASRNLTISKAVRVVSTTLTLDWNHKRAGVSLATGTWSFATDIQTVNLVMLEGDTLDFTAANLTTSAGVLLIYPTLT